MTTGDDHEVQESERYPWPLVVAVRPWLERRRRQRLIEFPAEKAGIQPIIGRSAARRGSSFGVSIASKIWDLAYFAWQAHGLGTDVAKQRDSKWLIVTEAT